MIIKLPLSPLTPNNQDFSLLYEIKLNICWMPREIMQQLTNSKCIDARDCEKTDGFFVYLSNIWSLFCKLRKSKSSAC